MLIKKYLLFVVILTIAMLFDRGKPQPCPYQHKKHGKTHEKDKPFVKTLAKPAGLKLTSIKNCINIHTVNPYLTYLKLTWSDSSTWEVTSSAKTDSYCKTISIPADRFVVGWTPYLGVSDLISGFVLKFDDGTTWNSKKQSKVSGKTV